jgi:hypothetical protein
MLRQKQALSSRPAAQSEADRHQFGLIPHHRQELSTKNQIRINRIRYNMIIK